MITRLALTLEIAANLLSRLGCAAALLCKAAALIYLDHRHSSVTQLLLEVI